jgi:hypothetical protein
MRVRVLRVQRQYDFPLWSALGTCLLGMADAQLARAEEGLTKVNEGIALYQKMKTPPVFWPPAGEGRGGAVRVRLSSGAFTSLTQTADSREPPWLRSGPGSQCLR